MTRYLELRWAGLLVVVVLARVLALEVVFVFRAWAWFARLLTKHSYLIIVSEPGTSPCKVIGGWNTCENEGGHQARLWKLEGSNSEDLQGLFANCWMLPPPIASVVLHSKHRGQSIQTVGHIVNVLEPVYVS